MINELIREYNARLKGTNNYYSFACGEMRKWKELNKEFLCKELHVSDLGSPSCSNTQDNV